MTQVRIGATVGLSTGYMIGLLLLHGCTSPDAATKPAGVSGADIYVVSPIKDANRAILPSAAAVPGVLSDTLNVVATPGEYEPASFVVRPERDIERLTFHVTDLKATTGRRIAASAVDLKVVKCWYVASDAEHFNEGVFNRGEFVLTPELLLNDDSLVLVDYERKRNYVRLAYADDYTGERLDPGDPPAPGYYWISNPDHDTGADRIEFPVNDAPTLRPVAIRGGENKQFWVTVHVPDDAAAGVYEGRINLKAGGEAMGGVALRMRVLPFRLAEPKTCYDPNEEFHSSIYYNEICDPVTDTSFLRNPKQVRADLANLYAHGVTNPIVRQWQDFFKLESLGYVMRVRQELGVRTKTMFYRGTPPHTFYELGGAEAVKAQVRKVMDFVKPWGIEEVYFYGIDEALQGKDEGLQRLLSQRPMWEAVHEAGGKAYSAGVRVGHYAGTKSEGGNFELIGDLQDMLVCHGPPSREEAARWHSVGHKVACYANPQSGKEEPERYRRNFGILLWRSNYDAAMTFAYMWLPHSILCWNDFAGPVGGYRAYNMVYPTDDGVIDTVQWEGYREGIDDIRYATTLMQAIAAAKHSKDDAAVALAAEAERYIEQVDLSGDLDGVRVQIIGYILRLKSHG